MRKVSEININFHQVGNKFHLIEFGKRLSLLWCMRFGIFLCSFLEYKTNDKFCSLSYLQEVYKISWQ